MHELRSHPLQSLCHSLTCLNICPIDDLQTLACLEPETLPQLPASLPLSSIHEMSSLRRCRNLFTGRRPSWSLHVHMPNYVAHLIYRSSMVKFSLLILLMPDIYTRWVQ